MKGHDDWMMDGIAWSTAQSIDMSNNVSEQRSSERQPDELPEIIASAQTLKSKIDKVGIKAAASKQPLKLDESQALVGDQKKRKRKLM